MSPTPQIRHGAKSRFSRVVYLLLFALVYGVSETVVFAVAMVQVISALVLGRSNTRLQRFGRELSLFIGQVVRFLTFADEKQPFPFSEWPRAVAPESLELPPGGPPRTHSGANNER